VTGRSGAARPSAAPAAAPSSRASSIATWTARIKLDEMVNRVLPLERINEAFELMHQGEVIRSVIALR